MNPDEKRGYFEDLRRDGVTEDGVRIVNWLINLEDSVDSVKFWIRTTTVLLGLVILLLIIGLYHF